MQDIPQSSFVVILSLCVIVLSHWPQVAELVAELVSSVNGSIEKHGHILGHKLLNLLLV